MLRSRNSISAIVLLFALASAVLPACGTRPAMAPGAQPTPILAPAPGEGFSKLAGNIRKHPDWYDGQEVTLVGYFRGQDLFEEVGLSAPADRLQDWVIKDNSGAIWVQYSRQLPFDPSSQEVWRIVRVSGEVEVLASNMPYIIPHSVTWEGLREKYDVLPASCLFAIHRFGGPDRLDHHIYWYDTNTLVVYDAKTNWRASARLTRGEVRDWERELAKVKFHDLPTTVGQECKGCVRYYIAAVDPKKNEPHFVTLYEGQVPGALQAFIDRLIAKTGEAREG